MLQLIRKELSRTQKWDDIQVPDLGNVSESGAINVGHFLQLEAALKRENGEHLEAGGQ